MPRIAAATASVATMSFHHHQPLPAAASGRLVFPGRPHADALSDSIQLFFVGRNRHGLWIVREAEGRAGGIFLFKKSAQRFAEETSERVGCATMFLEDPVELDVANQGNRAAGLLENLIAAVRRRVPQWRARFRRRVAA
jgi:hypothetical protein